MSNEFKRTYQGNKKGLKIERNFSTEGVHPYDEVEWQTRDVIQKNWKTGEVIFEQHGVEFPEFWSINASTIVTTKYFRGSMGSEKRERSLRQLIDRVVGQYVVTGKEEGYFATAKDAAVFSDELTWLLLHQYFSFNSPVWFNVGTANRPQVSACYILSVEDSMESILDWYKEEGLIFKGGSGAGLNLSNIRGSKEELANGGIASGPVSFMRGADASAGAIKSGGASRRAAKMVILDVDHPDIEEFVETKAKEENKIRALRDAGFNMDLDGTDIASVQFQNANNSVRVNDEFMKAVENNENYGLIARTTGEVIEEVNAKALMRKISQAAWGCADPGIQYDGAIQRWHTNKTAGRITGSNPCSEYLSLDNTSCNLASLNLLRFFGEDGFNVQAFERAVEIIITAMDISITFGVAPVQKITDNTRKFRQLGIGYTNLGALLMASGLGYDSDGGRQLAASITALMTGVAYRRSAEMAAVVGPYAGYKANRKDHNEVMALHRDALVDVHPVANDDTAIKAAAVEAWDEVVAAGETVGFRNAQASVAAPTGTISFMMDSDTTGIEPDFSLVKFKKLVGGGSMQIVNQTIGRALEALGYTAKQSEEIEGHILKTGTVVGAPFLSEDHYGVFDTAVGARSISAMGHVRMMAATQPFLSGAISKTVNLPETATVDEIEEVYMEGWRLGLKALAVYRDNCKVGQPLGDGDSKNKKSVAKETNTVVETRIEYRPIRVRLPRQRTGRTTSFEVAGASGYLTTGEYENGELGEVFIKLGKQGSTLAGVMDAFSLAVSIGLQYGVPLDSFVNKFSNMKFEPSGMTDDPDIRIAQSMVDYVFRKLAVDYLPFDERAALSIYTAEERKRQLETGVYEEVDMSSGDTVARPVATVKATETSVSTPVTASAAAPVVHNSAEAFEAKTGISVDAPLCLACGTKMQRAGSCFICDGCGATSGCS